MNEIRASDIASQFDSLSGGIPMWISRLADIFAEVGTDAVFTEMEEMSLRTQDHKLKDDLHFLRAGLTGIGDVALRQAVAPLRQPWQQRKEFPKRYQQCAELQKQAEAEWHIAAKNASRQLELWERWAYETELANEREVFPWKLSSWGANDCDLSLHFEICGARNVLEAPHKLNKGLKFFMGKIGFIRKIVNQAYLSDQLPVNFRVSDFEDAINDITKCQIEVDSRSDASEQVMKDWKGTEETYFLHKGALTELLWRMPRSAHTALFWICRPDLRESRTAS